MTEVGRGIVGASKVAGDPMRTVGDAVAGEDRAGSPDWSHDGVLIGRSNSWNATVDSLELSMRCAPYQMDALESFLGEEGKLEKLAFSDGSFVHADRSLDGNTVVLDPPSDAEEAFGAGVTWLPESFDDRTIDQAGDVAAVNLSLRRESSRGHDRDGSYAARDRGAGEWKLDFANAPQPDSLSTDRVSAQVSSKTEEDIASVTLDVNLGVDEAGLLVTALSRIEAVSERDVPDGRNRVDDNTTSSVNTVELTAPGGAPVDSGWYVATDWTATWLHDKGYRLTVSLSPA